MIYGVFLCGGLVAPFVIGLGYVWVDTFSPQHVAYSLLNEIPVSAIMAAAAIGSYLLIDRKAPPRPGLIMVLVVMMACWVTYTSETVAVVPEFCWSKWDWAIKTIGFAVFMPFLFRSRVQIEAFLQVYIFSAAIQIVPYGVKTILSGGSYHANLGLLTGNSGLAEGSTLATVATMGVPIVLWLRRYSLILPRIKLVKLMYLGLAISAVSASIGTFERTGLVAIVIVAVGLWLQSEHKIRYAIYGAAVAAIGALVVIRPDSEWLERMSTMAHYHQDTSAEGRILVWKWTLNFVKTHPLGGGFNSYVIDTIQFPGEDASSTYVVHGKAFHSMYFEMLGEHGWPGIGLFLTLLVTTFLTLVRVALKCRKLPEMAWCRDLAIAFMIAELVLVVCGAFIGIAFQPEVYYTFAMTAMLAGHVRTVERKVGPIRPPVIIPNDPTVPVYA
jgi:probable O-glycosylation ligase (exosortase A-associated)